MRVFFAHPKKMADEETDRLLKAVRQSFESEGEAVKVVAGRDDYNTYGPSAGTFQAWAVDVVTRRNADGSPFYDAIIVPGQTIGAATRIIVQGAMASQIPVLVVQENDSDTGMAVEFALAREVVTEDEKDYVSGWWIDT